jgi:hypothetical protein
MVSLPFVNVLLDLSSGGYRDMGTDKIIPARQKFCLEISDKLLEIIFILI